MGGSDAHHANRHDGAVAAFVVGALALAGCGSKKEPASNAAAANGPVTLNVRLFGTFGYKEAGLFDAYHTAHPNITINYSSIEQEQNYYPVLQQNLNAAKGTMDVVGIEVGRIADVTQNLSSKFTDLKQFGAGSEEASFYPWKWKAATTADGTVVGLGTDIGPIAIAYRTDLFKQAGLPTNRDELASKWTSWDAFLAMGQQYKARMGARSAFIDTSSGFYNTVLGGSEKQYYDESGTPVYDSNPAVRQAWDLSVKAIQQGLTGKVKQFDDAWNKGFASGAFATVGAPSWMIGYIKGQAGDAGSGRWDVAPGPTPANWGGSYLAVPRNSQHPKEAYDLVKYLTAAPQQVTLFQKGGNFPSNSVAAADPAVLFCTLAGFAFAKLRFRFSSALLGLTIGTMLIPPSLGVIPLHQMMVRFGWVDQLQAVILPTLVTAFGVFFMRQYLLQAMPTELLEAGWVDGASTFRIFLSIVLPVARPAMAVLGMLTFLQAWNDFFWPILVLQADNPTVQVGLNNLGQGYVPDRSVILAGTLLTTVPVIVVFAALGRQIVGGIMHGAVKG